MKNYDPAPIHLRETAFQNLMQRRVHNVLLIASPYDTFMLEEDGRVEDAIHREYTDLNLSSPPRFIKVGDFARARERMRYLRPDLVIVMPGVEIGATLQEIASLRHAHPGIPTVLLLPFARQVSRRLANEDLSCVDFVFSWLGNVDLILAIIKLIEDRMNADNDILRVGVKCIMVVEDTTRFYSAMLPQLYRFLLTQSRNFSEEALNDHERMLRMRGRAKVLFCRDYNSAQALLRRFRGHMLGVVTDVRYPRDGRLASVAGLRLTEEIHAADPYMPVIIASTEQANRARAMRLGAMFIDKESKTMPQDLRAAVRRNFGFGDFVVYDPDTGLELMRIRNLAELQKSIFDIPDRALFTLCSTNAVSRWLNSRALFPIADAIEKRHFTELGEAPAVRRLVFDAIVAYRRMKNRGVVAIYRRDRFDRYSNFARIGQGSMGGKGRGLAFIDSCLKRIPEDRFPAGATISIPRTVVLCTDVFDDFMELNDLYPTALSDASDREILDAFLRAELPREVADDLRALLRVMERPLAVRSSSLLEDSHYQPFAGIYSTYMIPYTEGNEDRQLRLLQKAIKSVYASTYFAASKAYVQSSQNLIAEEKMAVVIQEVCGTEQDGLFFPTLSGVARSINYYPIGDETPEEGVCNIALGLGKLVVDGGRTLRFSPRYPQKVLQTSTPELALRDTQNEVLALDLRPEAFRTSTDDAVNIRRLTLREVAPMRQTRFVASVWDRENDRISDSPMDEGRKVITFNAILKYNTFPLADIVRDILRLGVEEMRCPVEVEFAVNMDVPYGQQRIFNLLQIRPIIDNNDNRALDWRRVPTDDALIYARNALGVGNMNDIRDIVYVKPERFDSLSTQAIAGELDALNARMREAGRGYILVGPGRWGSSDPFLGIPVKWQQITEARVIVECGLERFRVEPSQGTHFFQNVTSLGVGYLTINPFMGDGRFDAERLGAMPAAEEGEYLRRVSFPAPLWVYIDGRSNKGIVRTEPPAGEE